MRLIQGNCLEEMAKLEAGSVDLTVTSPPYDNLRTYNGTLNWGEHVWKPVLEELFRITKHGGVVVWVVGDATIKGSETGTSFKQALYAKDCGFNLHDTMIWRKTNPTPRDTRIKRYWQEFEYMFVFTKGVPKTCNHIRVESKHKGKKKVSIMRKADGTLREDRREKQKTSVVNETKPLCNIWEFAAKADKEHPAPFPLKLANDHVITWSNKGDTVLDPFMGSGTTGKMALSNGRDFIGIELDPGYFEIARQRINTALEC